MLNLRRDLKQCPLAAAPAHDYKRGIDARAWEDKQRRHRLVEQQLFRYPFGLLTVLDLIGQRHWGSRAVTLALVRGIHTRASMNPKK